MYGIHGVFGICSNGIDHLAPMAPHAWFFGGINNGAKQKQSKANMNYNDWGAWL